MKIAYWIVTGLFCLLMLAAAAMEIFGFAESAAFVKQLGYPAYIAYVLPVTKILGVAAILTKYSETLKEWATPDFSLTFRSRLWRIFSPACRVRCRQSSHSFC